MLLMKVVLLIQYSNEKIDFRKINLHLTSKIYFEIWKCPIFASSASNGLTRCDEYSSLDIDALKIVSNGVNALRNSERSFLIITHYQRLLNYIKPDFVHVLSNGKIVESGDWKLALDLENNGYGKYLN